RLGRDQRRTRRCESRGRSTEGSPGSARADTACADAHTASAPKEVSGRQANPARKGGGEPRRLAPPVRQTPAALAGGVRPHQPAYAGRSPFGCPLYPFVAILF